MPQVGSPDALRSPVRVLGGLGQGRSVKAKYGDVIKLDTSRLSFARSGFLPCGNVTALDSVPFWAFDHLGAKRLGE